MHACMISYVRCAFVFAWRVVPRVFFFVYKFDASIELHCSFQHWMIDSDLPNLSLEVGMFISVFNTCIHYYLRCLFPTYIIYNTLLNETKFCYQIWRQQTNRTCFIIRNRDSALYYITLPWNIPKLIVF